MVDGYELFLGNQGRLTSQRIKYYTWSHARFLKHQYVISDNIRNITSSKNDDKCPNVLKQVYHL